MNTLKISLLSGILILIVGCSENTPRLNKSMKIITLANGKEYRVPIDAIYTKEPVTDKMIVRYTEFGVQGCKKEDITWEDKHVADEINQVMRTGEKEEGIAIYKKAAKAGTIGCASSL